MNTIAQALRKHALFHSTGRISDIRNVGAWEAAFDMMADHIVAAGITNHVVTDPDYYLLIARMSCLFLAESLENPC